MELEERHLQSTSYELHTIGRDSPDQNVPESSTSSRQFSLPPVDGGKDAWLCLMGGFCLEVMVWGSCLFFSMKI